MKEYEEVKQKLAQGWNTWNTRSVLSHVLLPEGFALNLCIKEYQSGKFLKEALIGRFGEDDEIIHPGSHSYDGSYTHLNLKWRGIEIIVESATVDDDIVLLITPVNVQKHPPTLVAETAILWNRPGKLVRKENSVSGEFDSRTISIYSTCEEIFEPNVPVQTPYMAFRLECQIGISTGRKRSIEDIKQIINSNKCNHEKIKERYGNLSEVYNAMQSCMAWDTIYEPKKDRVITPVSRLWSTDQGGYVLFCWDTYFAALMASVDNKELAYSNAIEITREKTENGFVPNMINDTGFKTRDRSQPPVGSLVVREIYRKYREKWMLEEVFDDLFEWNNWFIGNRGLGNGTLAWGSNFYEPILDNEWELKGVNDTYGGALESGLDNSPMYDGVAFDKEKSLMKLADTGLTGLYIMDCLALADIARILGQNSERDTLLRRADKSKQGLMSLWSNDNGIFLNMHTDTGELDKRLSPTNFYGLFSDSIPKTHVERVIDEHFYNPEEFWGEWILPSISRNDPAYKDQDYWRGRIWAPMNFLVYLAFRNQGMKKACSDLSEKSKNLLLKEWLQYGHVHENYCGDTGEGCGKHNSDKFYHWGALLSLIALIEEGYIEGPECSVE